MDEISDNQFNGAIEIRPEVAMLSVLRHPHCKSWSLEGVRLADLQVEHG